MSQISKLKEADKYNINIVDIINTLVSVKQTKYVELLLRILENGATENLKTAFLKDISDRFKVNIEDFKKYTPLQVCVIYPFICKSFEDDDENIEEFHEINKFFTYNERGLVTNKDLMTYKSTSDILSEVKIIDDKLEEKKLEKEIIKLLDTDEWLVLKPLTYSASKKYGATTKWCTTNEKEDKYFKKYTKEGVLIYSINRKTGYKVATYYALDGSEFSFWNEKDEKIESATTKLSNEIISIIRDECLSPNVKSNESIYIKKNNKIKNKVELAIERENDISDIYNNLPFGEEDRMVEEEITEEEDVMVQEPVKDLSDHLLNYGYYDMENKQMSKPLKKYDVYGNYYDVENTLDTDNFIKKIKKYL